MSPGSTRCRCDSDGFLLGGPRDEIPDATVIMLGDSTIEDRYLDEPARTASRLAVEMRERTGKKVNVHNGAVSGANSLGSLLSLLVKVLPMRPRAITLMHSSNDLKQLLYFGSYWETFGRHTLLRERSEPGGATAGWRSLALRLGSAIKRRIAPPKKGTASNAQKQAREIWWEYMVPERGFATRDASRLNAEYARNLNLFISICSDSGIVPVLLTQPNRLTDAGPDAVLKIQMNPIFRLGMSYADYKALFDSFNETVRRVARKRNARLVNLARLIPQEPRYIWDSLHFTELGAAAAARHIAEVLGDIPAQGMEVRHA